MEITNFNVGSFKNHSIGRDVTMMYDGIVALLYFLKDIICRHLQYLKCLNVHKWPFPSSFCLAHISHTFDDVMMMSQ